jgi:hypothetical protein
MDRYTPVTGSAVDGLSPLNCVVSHEKQLERHPICTQLISLINKLLPFPIAEEIEPHIIALN